MKLLSHTILLVFCICGGCVNNLIKEDVAVYAGSKVYKSFMITLENSIRYPRTEKTFIEAVEAWEKVIPVECRIIHGNFGPRNSISVTFCDIQTTLQNIPEGVVGLFMPNEQMLLIDTDNKDSDSDAIYNTCVHELGHAFGLPHIIGKIDKDGKSSFKYGMGGNILLERDSDAAKCIMYPVEDENDSRRSLQPVEIMWARHFLMHDMNVSLAASECRYYQAGVDPYAKEKIFIIPIEPKRKQITKIGSGI